MKQISILLYIMIIVTLAAATLLGRIYGQTFAEDGIYNATWFFLLWLMTGIAAICLLVKGKIWKKPCTALLHLSFLIILSGAATTFFTGTKGYMHITPGKPGNFFTDADSGKKLELPFTIELDSFVVKYYNGTEVPADYVSHIKIDGNTHTVSMNKIVQEKGYRLYQSSYDKEGGSLLSISYDPYGNAITYTGYVLLFVASCLLLLSRREGFCKLLKHPSLKRGTTLMLLTLLCCAGIEAKELSADNPARRQVLYKGRIAPLDTQARDFLKKLSGRDNYNGMRAVEVMTEWQSNPKRWHTEPVIKIKDRALREKLGIKGEHASLSQLYDENREYKLQKILEETKADGRQQTMAKAIFETDEKVAMILMLLGGTFINELPGDGSIRPLSPSSRDNGNYIQQPAHNKNSVHEQPDVWHYSLHTVACRNDTRHNREHKKMVESAEGYAIYRQRNACCKLPDTLVHRWSHTTEQRLRNNDILGIEHTDNIVPYRETLFICSCRRLSALGIHTACGTFGRDEPTNNAPDAGACIAPAEYTRLTYNDSLCTICFYNAGRHCRTCNDARKR